MCHYSVADNPVISARVGTFKRKQQVRHFLETMSKDNVDDVFSSSYMRNKRFEVISLSISVFPNIPAQLTASSLFSDANHLHLKSE